MASQPRCRKCRLACRWIVLDPVDRLARQPDGLCDLGNARGLPKLVSHRPELLSCEARLAAAVFALAGLLGVIDAGALSGLDGLGLRLGRRSHKGNKRVPDGLMDRILGGTIESHAVDDGFDYDPAAHELADGFDDVIIVAAEPVDPPDHKHIARPKLVEEAPPFSPLHQARADAACAVVEDRLGNLEAGRFGLGQLVVGGLLDRAHPAIEDSRHFAGRIRRRLVNQISSASS
jgi:hypothetical protein